MKRAALLTLALLATACSSHWLLDKDALGRTMSNDPRAAAIVGTDAEPALSVKPGEPGFYEEGPPGERQLHLYSRSRNTTTVVATKTLHRDLRIQVIARYSGPPSKSTSSGK